jgi:hypothetical protein
MRYERCEDATLEEGFEKVALYTKDSVPTHMYRQLENGEWTSKCGQREDIAHQFEDLDGDLYGAVTLIMKRRIGG